ncbi:MAG: hypothetical protein L6R37_003543 [Teloschistes peruensis]|nr:MAG: hypothetical protein L6R37_003543 [Teloschistes peruensis]
MSRVDELSQSSRPAESTPPTFPYERGSDSSPVSSGFESDDQDDKDSLELELEKAVFGDDSGFHQRLNEHSHQEDSHIPFTAQRNDLQIRRERQELENIQDLEDADLFVLDSAPSGKLVTKTSSLESQASKDDAGAAWYDSDDERIVISLQDNPRLRKLRSYEDEDLVNGVEYTKRLRRQFEHLNPVPGWALQSSHEIDSERSRRDHPHIPPVLDQRSESDDEMSVDSGDLSSAPLARFLQQPSSLIQRQPSTSQSGKRKLRSEVIEIQRTKDVGGVQPSAVTSLEFHPHHAILLSSGPASTISLHHISPHPPNPNPLLTSLHIRSTSLATSSFLPPNGSKALFAGRRRYFHSWDLETGRVDKISRIHGHEGEQKTMERFKLSPCGRWMGLVGSQRKGGGLINVLDANTKQWIAEVRVESKGGVADFAWWRDGNGMTVLGKGGEAVEWEGKQKKILARWVDEGAVGTTIVAMGGHGTGAKDLGNDRWVAVGSSSGIVNVYDRKNWEARDMAANPKPVRAFDQLTTPTSHLNFSPDGQLMVMASRWKRDALRIGEFVRLITCPKRGD